VSTPQPSEIEIVPRGLLLSLVTIPAGIAAWLVLWNFGFVASIVAWGAAFLATWLYRLGAGRIGRSGVIVVVAVTVVTLVLALIAGFAWDVAALMDRKYGVSWTEALGRSDFWPKTFAWMFDSSNVMTLLLAVLFGFLGCFWTLRRLVRTTRPTSAPAAPGTPGIPPMSGGPASTPEQIGPDREQLPPASGDAPPR